MVAPFTLPLDIELWADRETLFAEQHETKAQPEEKEQQEPEGAL